MDLDNGIEFFFLFRSDVVEDSLEECGLSSPFLARRIIWDCTSPFSDFGLFCAIIFRSAVLSFLFLYRYSGLWATYAISDIDTLTTYTKLHK